MNTLPTLTGSWALSVRVVLLTIVVARSAGAGELSERSKDWLDEVSYIMSDVERAAFLALSSERERGSFQRSFWEAREGERPGRRDSALDEHQGRVREADRLFGEGSNRGSRTVRGRVFTLLGEPAERQSFAAGDGLGALDCWIYHGQPAHGLPALFGLLFYQSGDGPWELFISRRDRLERLEAASASLTSDEVMGRLERKSADLAQLARSPLFGADAGPVEWLYVALNELRNLTPFDPSYLSDGDEDIGSLNVAFHGGFARDGGGGVVQFVVEVPPERLTLAVAGDRFRGDLVISGWIETLEGVPVAPIDDRVRIALSADELERVKSYPLAYEDIVPMVPGSYRAFVAVQSPVTGSIGWARRKFDVPQAADGELRLGPLLIAARKAPAVSQPQRPFVLGDSMFYPARSATIDFVGVLIVAFEVSHPPVDEAATFPVRYRISQGEDELFAGFDRVEVAPATRLTAGAIQTGMRGMPPGAYTVTVEISSDEAVQVKGKAGFRVVEGAPEVYPWLYLRQRRDDVSTRLLMLAQQQLALGAHSAAISSLERASVGLPTGNLIQIQLAHVLSSSREYARTVEVTKSLREAGVRLAPLEELEARAQLELGRPSEALAAYERAVSGFPRSVRLLNALADVAAKNGAVSRAIQALQSSLAIEPNQRQVAASLRRLESEAARQ